MLVTIARGKAGRIRLPGSESNASWRDLFKQYEDLLTGAFFGRIRYLSAPLFTQVIELLTGSTNAKLAGGLRDIEFWPDLIGLEGRSRVQPDVLINLDNAAILIEVKPPKGPGQSFTQWYEQLNAFAAECRNEQREAPPLVHYVALGRNAQPQAEDPDDPLDFGEAAELLDLTIHRLEWGQVVASVSAWLDKARCGELKVTSSDVAVLEDLVECLELFGVRRRTLLPWSHLSDWTTKQDLRLRKPALSYASLKSVVPERYPCPITWDALADYANKNRGRTS